MLAVLRSDYMLHTPTNSLLQVELNTIASSFGCLSTLVGRMHRYLLGRLGASEAELAALPEHNTMDAIADAMGAAAAEYGVPGGVMVMVVQPGERNAFDQQWLQTRLWERHGVRTLRRSLAEVSVSGVSGKGWGGGVGEVQMCGRLQQLWLAHHHPEACMPTCRGTAKCSRLQRGTSAQLPLPSFLLCSLRRRGS